MHEPTQRQREMLAQTARIHWPELERHFARGAVLQVAADLDLVAVAAALADDDKAAAGDWLNHGQLRQLDAAVAKAWASGEPQLWAVVVAPWILVQERRCDSVA